MRVRNFTSASSITTALASRRTHLRRSPGSKPPPRSNLAEAQSSSPRSTPRGQGITQDNAKAIAVAHPERPRTDISGRSLRWRSAIRTGSGVAKDDAKAFTWYRAAAEAGSRVAQRVVGSAYLGGQGTERDLVAAVLWLTKAAQAGDAGAQSNLGDMHATCTGITQDDAIAADWYRKAADQGLLRAQAALALFYETGRGVAADDAEAATWYRRAAMAGYQPAYARLGHLLVMQGGIADRAEAANWIYTAAQEGIARPCLAGRRGGRRVGACGRAAGATLCRGRSA